MASPIVSRNDSETSDCYYKTRMCRWFLVGKCRYETGCSWAHDQSELRSTVKITPDSPTPSLSALPGKEDMPVFVPDFSADVLEDGCRIIRIPQEVYLLAVRATQLNQPFSPPQPPASNMFLSPAAEMETDPSLSILVTKPNTDTHTLLPPAAIVGKADSQVSPHMHALVAVTPSSPGILVLDEPPRSRSRSRTASHTRNPPKTQSKDTHTHALDAPQQQPDDTHTDGGGGELSDSVHINVPDDVCVELAQMVSEVAHEIREDGSCSGK
eukprot:GDKI01031181.1.p1 GENE.GDKI01031181.1~~GDKI01031181.1.p1  ORF type:complete len:269 (-),score=84.07 GDKI01031181.1:58-864(-)